MSAALTTGLHPERLPRPVARGVTTASPAPSDDSRPWAMGFLIVAAVNCAFQIAWFWHYCARNINYDAISYLGIARHILDGNFRASLHGYWSPLISWCIAALAFFDHSLPLSARVLTILSFLACLRLLYLLSFRLWASRSIAALSMLCFTLARAVVATSVYFIGADFLLTAIVIAYFIVLLRCLRMPTGKNWLTLGFLHGAAFLAKAFAMPWLCLSTVISAVLSTPPQPRKVLINALAGLAIPLLVWSSWGMLLKTKYGRFTAGYQSKWNLLTAGQQRNFDHPSLRLLVDTSHTNDQYLVTDEMYPGAPSWDEKIDARVAIREILLKEVVNLPRALKEIIILLTPGGLLALVFAVYQLRRAGHYRVEAIWAGVVLSSSVALAIGYSMLIFDRRYVIPVIPPLMALAGGGLISRNTKQGAQILRALVATLFFGSVIFLASYSASPFRNIRRDYQTGAYNIAAELREIPRCDRLVVIGKGPFPEHGVGWEEGIYASYFAQCKIVGFAEELGGGQQSAWAAADIASVRANAVLLLGTADAYSTLRKLLQQNSGFTFGKAMENAADGRLGVLLWK